MYQTTPIEKQGSAILNLSLRHDIYIHFNDMKKIANFNGKKITHLREVAEILYKNKYRSAVTMWLKLQSMQDGAACWKKTNRHPFSQYSGPLKSSLIQHERSSENYSISKVKTLSIFKKCF